jgi:hypothetical protein
LRKINLWKKRNKLFPAPQSSSTVPYRRGTPLEFKPISTVLNKNPNQTNFPGTFKVL